MSDVADVNEIVKTYLTIRHEREILSEQYTQQDALLKEDLEKLERIILDQCNDLKADTIRTESGTAMRVIKDKFICGDWDNFRKFVVENDVPELFAKHIHQGNLKEYMDSHTGEGLPPGISSMREYSVVVRKPRS